MDDQAVKRYICNRLLLPHCVSGLSSGGNLGQRGRGGGGGGGRGGDERSGGARGVVTRGLLVSSFLFILFCPAILFVLSLVPSISFVKYFSGRGETRLLPLSPTFLVGRQTGNGKIVKCEYE